MLVLFCSRSTVKVHRCLQTLHTRRILSRHNLNKRDSKRLQPSGYCSWRTAKVLCSLIPGGANYPHRCSQNEFETNCVTEILDQEACEGRIRRRENYPQGKVIVGA